jgi:hypothetical protein
MTDVPCTLPDPEAGGGCMHRKKHSHNTGTSFRDILAAYYMSLRVEGDGCSFCQLADNPVSDSHVPAEYGGGRGSREFVNPKRDV